MILKHFNIKIWWYLRKLFSEHFGSVAYTILGNVEFCHIWITNVFKYIPLVFVLSMFAMQNLANLQIRLIYRFPWHLTQVLLIKASYQLISYILLLNMFFNKLILNHEKKKTKKQRSSNHISRIHWGSDYLDSTPDSATYVVTLGKFPWSTLQFPHMRDRVSDETNPTDLQGWHELTHSKIS